MMSEATDTSTPVATPAEEVLPAGEEEEDDPP